MNTAYQKIVLSLKRRRNGCAAADVCAATALPLETVRELLPKIADEYSGHLQVTQSGEILYTFPNGFTSRYRGLFPAFKKLAAKCAVVTRTVLVFLFKMWIMLMLTGYFVLFLAIAIAGVVISVSARNSGGRRSGGVFAGPNLFGFLWRLWFFSEVTKPRYGYETVMRKNSEEKRPMHKAVFSFVFGEDDPNSGWEERESKAVIAYIQANRGVISLAEYMAFSGKDSCGAEESLLAFCAKYGGSPEVTDEGTIVYRFDDLLLRANTRDFAELSPPVKRLKKFSANSKKMNGAFIAINAVNLIFGTYFLYHSFSVQPSSYLYGLVYYILGVFASDPASIIKLVLGLIPLVFSVLFWLIPAARRFMENRENEKIKLSNYKRLGFGKIWTAPVNVELSSLVPVSGECRPKNLAAAGDRVVKDMGAVSSPEVEKGENGKFFYSFRELEYEKRALQKYRANLDPARARLGKKVFDTAE